MLFPFFFFKGEVPGQLQEQVGNPTVRLHQLPHCHGDRKLLLCAELHLLFLNCRKSVLLVFRLFSETVVLHVKSFGVYVHEVS